MSTSSPRELNARDVRIIETREEITLLFGAPARDSIEGGELLIDSAAQVILAPAAAKRLSRVLKDVIARHESTHGSIGASSGADQRKPSSVGNEPSPPLVDQTSGTNSLISRIDALGVTYGLEHSFKIFPGAILGNRVLLGFPRDELRNGAAADTMLRLCRDLDMPHRFQKIYREHLDEANILLFGFEGKEGGGGICKAYLEFGGMFETMVREYPEKPPSFLIHLGFKWDMEDNRKATLTRYTCYPAFTIHDILKRIHQRFYPGQGTGAFEIVRGIVEKAAAAARPDEFLYVEVAEENNPRSSFDINLYRANLTLEELYPLLREACRSWKIPPESFHRLYDPMKERIFGHISGGIDREGREFLTFYYGVKGSAR